MGYRRRRSATACRCRSITAAAWSAAAWSAWCTVRPWSILAKVSIRWLCCMRLQDERCTVLIGGADDVHCDVEPPRISRASTCHRLRTGMIGGAPCPVEVMRRLIDELGMRDITIIYGMTETSPVSTQTSCDDTLEQRVTTVGQVHPHRGDQDRRSRRAHGAARHPGRDLHARLFRYAGILERCWSRRLRRSIARAGCTPAISARWTRTATSPSPAASRTW